MSDEDRTEHNCPDALQMRFRCAPDALQMRSSLIIALNFCSRLFPQA
jgi:hypothetical protein